MRIGQHNDDVPVLLVRHGAREILMRRRTVYDDMISALRNKLRLDDDAAVSLRVMLDEKDAEIDEDAWSVVVPYLDQVNVDVAPTEVGDEKGKGKEHKRTPSIHSAEDLFGNNAGVGGSGSQSSEWDHVDDVPAPAVKIENPEIKQEPELEDEDEDEGSPPPRRRAPVKPTARAEEPPSPAAPKAPKFKPAPPAPSPVKHVLSSPVKSPSQGTEKLNATDPNERFKITVRGPEAEQRAALLTRGRYPVRKVLNAVCKVFGVDPDGARLSLLVPVGDDDFEKFPCDVDETMAHAGVEPDAELVLELEEGNGEEEDDDDE
ncbi:hypothetical protein BDZ89DRAFT_1058580 [Hymenopellis radicata]|nr:hypothetical protein BDZ89DRAFT_1058580 [Hymenopellis radicata]